MNLDICGSKIIIGLTVSSFCFNKSISLFQKVEYDKDALSHLIYLTNDNETIHIDTRKPTIISEYSQNNISYADDFFDSKSRNGKPF